MTASDGDIADVMAMTRANLTNEEAPPQDRSEPSPDAVAYEEGDAVLQDVERFIRRFVAFPNEAAVVATVLWLAHTHAIDCFDSTPRLAIVSPEKQSGKTRLGIDVAGLLVAAPMAVASCSPAALFRSIDKSHPTVLFDEVDTIFGAGAAGNDDLKAMLNVGHRRGAQIPRCVGDREIAVRMFSVYAAVALVGIGDLPDTLMDRSIVIRMRKRASDEAVEFFRAREVEPHGHTLRRRLAAWAERKKPSLESHWPEMPAGVTDRPADVWEPLLIVADIAGGEWPERARRAAQILISAQAAEPTSLGVQLLSDSRRVFYPEADDERAPPSSPLDHITSEELVRSLGDMNEAPWGDLLGKQLTVRGLAQRLKPYDVRPRKYRDGAVTCRGYLRSDFEEAWRRYLPSPPEAEQAEQAEQGRPESAPGVPDSGDVPEDGGSTDHVATRDVPDVPDVPVSAEGRTEDLVFAGQWEERL